MHTFTLHVYTYVCTYVCMYVHMYVYVCMYVCMYVCIYTTLRPQIKGNHGYIFQTYPRNRYIMIYSFVMITIQACKLFFKVFIFIYEFCIWHIPLWAMPWNIHTMFYHLSILYQFIYALPIWNIIGGIQL